MGKRKKRRTKQEKIILQLKKEIAQQKRQSSPEKEKTPSRQEAILPKAIEPIERKLGGKSKDDSSLFQDVSLVKKDLLKSLILTIAIFSLEVMLYLKLK